MEKIQVGHKEFNLVQIISDKCSIVERNGKRFFLRKLDSLLEDGDMQIYCAKRLSTSGVNFPKIYKIDKKRELMLSEYIEGENLAQFLSSSDMPEKAFENLFINAYMAKRNHMTLDYLPENFIIQNDKLFYIALFYKKYDKSEDLTEKYIRLYFNTTDLMNYLKTRGIIYDKSRIKDQYQTNKDIVLMTCKYYR